MSVDEDDRSLRGLFGDWLRRKLQPAEPQTWIEGGGSTRDDVLGLRDRERDLEQLEKWEQAYVNGGPVAQLVDTRALMTFGAGSEFITRDEDVTVAGPEGEPESVAEWLERQLPNRDNLFVEIARDNYIYGDSFQEVVDTRGGDFSHVVTVNPKTVTLQFDANGSIQRYIQEIDDSRAGPGRTRTQEFDPEDIGHIALQRLGRHPTGVSLIGRNWDEITRFAKNQHAIAKTVERHGHRKWHVKVGPEDRSHAVDDNELRRSRQRFQSVKRNDAVITGRHVDIDTIDEGASVGDGIGSIAENDLTMLAAGFGVPEEMAGLGRGSTEATAKVRLQAFERTARAEQATLADQFVEQIVRPILDEYSPFPRDVHVDLRFDDVVSDQAATAEWLRDFKGVYTPDEMRQKLGDGPIPEDVDESELGVPGDEGETPSVTEGGFFARERGHARALSGAPEWEPAFERVYEDVLWSSESRQLLGFGDEDVPKFVIDRLREAVLSGTLFSDFETVPDEARMDIQTAMLDSLEERHGWSIDSIRENLQEAVPQLEADEAERIARTETQALVNDAREQGYREQFDVGAERFKWVGPDDTRNSDVCPDIKQRVPEEGLPMDALKATVQQTAREHGHDPREWTPHVNCRHTYVRVVN